ncbi:MULTISPECIES: helix-turn-helix transcriptional regulator [Paenibacillus]|uniref:ArsR/SmtB family transcription factor n=1 Tax=Paenibacillus TaxID=44249 RepID=UPI0004B707C8|nr:metalloregulator ArsR/SmtB family transcription factor [Paenibacillus gorillae]
MEITTFSALSDPNRLHIVELLLEGSLTVGEIAERLQIRQPQVSKHLRILLDAGLVEVQAEANRRRYKLRLEPLQEIDAWLADYLRIWDERFGKLEHYLDQLKGRKN